MKQTVLLLVALAEALIGAQPATLTPAQTLDRRRLTRILAWYDKYLTAAAAPATPQR